jgi:FtsH ternary system domain X6
MSGHVLQRTRDKGQGTSAKVVTAFEGRLLRILHAVLRNAPPDQAQPLVFDRVARPVTLSRTCVELVADSLAKGCMNFLVRAGGWRRERFLRAGQPRDGRLWERWQPKELGLAFSRHALEFLIWITAHRPGDQKPPLALPAANLTPADRLLVFLTYDILRDTEAAQALRALPAVAQDGLIALACIEDFAGTKAEPDFVPWMSGLGAAMLEALQPLLCERWIAVERHKVQIGDWAALRDLGLVQERVLTAVTEAAETAGRPDLVRFVLKAAAAILPPGVTPDAFVGGLQGTGPPRLADRIEVHRRALALPRHLERLRGWEQKARGVGYLDDGYAASQVWKSDWEQVGGDELAGRAAALVRQVEPLGK